jgi:HEAT repeat protein
MKHNWAVLLLGIFLLLGNVVFAQQDQDSGGQLSIEELYLSQDVEVQIMRSQALANDRESKLLALQTIRSIVDSGQSTVEEGAVVAVLESLGGEGVYRVVRQGGSVINNFPEVRRQAANLLGEVGGDSSKTVLLKMLNNDNEPMVLAEAVFALGKIGINTVEVTESMVSALRRNTLQIVPDNNFAFATLLALERLRETDAGIARANILQALIEVVSGNYIEVVKLKAVDLISSLRQ